jgi:(R,R)-butanediol dehydrogenase/meso-butanediol dehydrogenase/diacetyl reductase/L-iditol 2-dehydrogenase
MIRTGAILKPGSLKDPDPTKRGKLGVIELPDRELRPETIKIKVAYCAICGSDPHTLEGGYFPGAPAMNAAEFQPRGFGHEISGVVVEVGANATHRGLKVGDRVGANFVHFCGDCDFCLDGQQNFCLNSREYSAPGCAEYVTWHEQQFYKLPDDVSLKEGCLLEPTGICVRMVDKLDMKVGQNTLVCGGGPIGLIALQLLSLFGASNLTMIEPIAARRDLAKSFGAVHTIDPFTEDTKARCMEITNGRGFDKILDASGALSMMTLLLEVAKRGATVIYGAMYPVAYDMPLNLATYMYGRELTLSGVMIAPYVFPRTVNIMSRLDLRPFVECVFPLDKVHDAMEMQYAGTYPKVFIECNPGLE